MPFDRLSYELRSSREKIERFRIRAGNSARPVGIAFPYGRPSSIGGREIEASAHYYSYARVNANRNGLVCPHIVESSINILPVHPFALLGRNPYLGGQRDFIMNVNEAIEANGWFIFYTHDLSCRTYPSLEEFSRMLRYVELLRDSGRMAVATVADGLSRAQTKGYEQNMTLNALSNGSKLGPWSDKTNDLSIPARALDAGYHVFRAIKCFL